MTAYVLCKAKEELFSYVTAALHGDPLPQFLRLLDKARFSDADDLIILGDVIDRNGDGGVEMLCWILQQVKDR